GLLRLARIEPECAGDARVVAIPGLGCAVFGAVPDSHRLRAGLGQADGEDERGLSGVALGAGHIAHANGGGQGAEPGEGLNLRTKRSGTLHGITSITVAVCDRAKNVRAARRPNAARLKGRWWLDGSRSLNSQIPTPAPLRNGA